MPSRPHVVIVGGGFGGLYAAKGLLRAPVDITLVDRENHHLFQPLLYEVATAALSPADIAAPIRSIFAGKRQVEVLLGEAVGVDLDERRLRLSDGAVPYDSLIVATGVTHSYFGHDAWAVHAPGLKRIDDAIEIRRRFLLAFEAAERERDAEARRARLTFVVVGAGPTGVEIAGTMSELARRGLPRDFRVIDTSTARVILVEGCDRVLPTFDRGLSERARRDLEKVGVEVRLDAMVTDIDADGVSIGDERVPAANVIWAAGVRASPLGRALGVPLDDAGRVRVEPSLSLPGRPEVFVIGDLATVHDPELNAPVPGVAPAAMQMGRHVASIIRAEARAAAAGKPAPSRAPYRYRDKGMLATIGRARAVGSLGRLKVAGLPAWLLWALVHITYLAGFGNRAIVLLRWAWAYFLFRRGARLITGDTDLELTGTDDDA
jgi:NADH dehydrogenase